MIRYLKTFLILLIGLVCSTQTSAQITRLLAKELNKFKTESNQGHVGIFFTYSQVNNVYEDENIKCEIIGDALYMSNKTDKPIYIDNKGSFLYINDADYCFFRGVEEKSGNLTFIEQEVKAIAPKSEFVNIRFFQNPYGGRQFKADAGGLSDKDVEFMGNIESLRSDLANANDKTSSAIHLEQDESILVIKAAINYSTSPRLENPISFMVSSWVSDVILAKFYPEPRNNDKKSSNAVSVRGRRKNVLHVFADPPYEYEEDKSPIKYTDIYFNKGRFSTKMFGISDESVQEAEKNKKDVNEARREETTFVWEGHSSDFETSLYDVVVRCQLQDGMEVKDAEKEAQRVVKNLVKEQTIKK